MLPTAFHDKLDAYLEESDVELTLPLLRKAQDEVSQTFRQQKGKAQWREWTLPHHLAYILARMPATYAVCHKVLGEAHARLVRAPATVLDVGAGGGAASWAASQLFLPMLKQLTAVENNPYFIKLLQKLHPEDVNWGLQPHRFLEAKVEPHDWVVMSYVLCEQSVADSDRFIEAGWSLAKEALLVIQPGTQQGYAQLMRARQQVINAGGQVVGPCPHQKPCPLAAGDWCHFSVRLTRDRTHHYLKRADRGFEDEKYAYFIAVKPQIAYSATQQRVIRHPLHRKGHVVLTLCEEAGIHQKTVSARHKPLYGAARDAEWGDDLGADSI